MSEGGPARPPRAAIVVAFLVTLLAVPLLAVPLAAPARAAHGGLVVIAATRYEVLPAEARVRVTIDAVATSHEPDPDEGRYYYSGTTFAVPADAENIAAFGRGSALPVRIVEESDDYQAVAITFSSRVFFGESYRYQVTFDLVDAGGVPDRDVRIGTSLAAFPVWAFCSAEEAGSTVVVQLPEGYEPTVQGSPMAIEPAGAHTFLRAAPDDPFAFLAYVSADRPGAYAEHVLEVALRADSARVTIRAWEDDPDWAARTADLLRRGLPVLEELIGVDYPHAGSLFVEEAAISRLGEYAGIFDPNAALIRVRYDADAFVTLHEAAHLWFNDRLLDGRWIGEAWAEYYSIEAGERLGAEGFRWKLTPQLRRSRIPLNDWGAVGREDVAVEDFAYAASYVVAGRIADRADPADLRAVWEAAASRELAYLLPDGAPDPGRARLGQPGWQRLLDLLEERTGERFDDLWAEWIVNEEERLLLVERASVRSQYRDTIELADEWVLPAVIRRDLGDWAFDGARDGLEQAEDILRDRDRIASLAASLELTGSDRLREAFEGGDGLAAADNLAEVELAALAELAAATERLDREPSPVERIGLIGADPGAALRAAREAYEEGQLGGARRGAAEAVSAREAAADEGRSRVLIAASGVLTLDGLLLTAVSAWRLAAERRLARLRRRAGGIAA
jgi:hypothetical protein